MPWSYLKSWTCYGCGNICCISSTVPLTINEWLSIIHNFGIGYTEPNMMGFYLKKTTDDRCVFQYQCRGHYLCSIQHMKPRACKLWPFKIYTKPKYGLGRESAFPYKGEIFYVYLDAACGGITYGQPSHLFIERTIPEFIELTFNPNEKQVYSTGNRGFQPQRVNLPPTYYSRW